MDIEDYEKKVSVGIIHFDKRDFTAMIRENLQLLEASFLFICPHHSQVIVRDGSPAHLKLRDAPVGQALTLRHITVDGILYRFYMVNSKWLEP